MSSNFEWEKFRANERVKERMRDAEAHRKARVGVGSSRVRVLPYALLLLGMGVLVAVMLWIG